MNKSQKGSDGKSVFYKPSQAVEEVRAGYLYKSPPSKRLKTEKSWKKRYFVLFKISENEYQLKYFRSAESKEKPLGTIGLLQISTLSMCPETHVKWALVKKLFKCPSSSVLYINSVDREYFLVAESSSEAENWFSDIFEALKNRPHIVSTEDTAKNGSMKTKENEYSDMRHTSERKTEMPKVVKPRSMSDPPPNMRSHSFSETQQQCVNRPRRPSSEPLNPIYDYPKSFLKNLKDKVDTSTKRDNDTDQPIVEDDSCHYMSMTRFRFEKVMVISDEEQAQEIYETVNVKKPSDEQQTQVLDSEVAEYCNGTLMRSVTHIFEKLKTQISPLPPFDEREDETDVQSQEASSTSTSSSDNEAASPTEMLQEQKPCTLVSGKPTESADDRNTKKIDVEIHLEDLKKYLKLMEVNGKPCVSGWTGHPDILCFFHKGDQILAINDIQNCSIDEYYFLVSRILKDQVKLTVVRLPGCQPLHSANCHSSN